MSDESLTVRVLIGDADHSMELARAVTYPEGIGDIAIEQDIPAPVARIGVSALESICLGLRLTLAGETDDCMSELEFDQNMRPVASDASRHAVAVLLAGMFANMGDNPPDTTDEAYAQMGDEAKGALERMAGILLDVAREASL